MIRLTNATNGKDVYVRTKYVIAVYPGTTGSEVLTITGVVYLVKEGVQEVLSAVYHSEIDAARDIPS